MSPAVVANTQKPEPRKALDQHAPTRH